jgi:hypothetical protein
MKAARVYVSLTSRSLTGKTLDWMRELVDEFGDEEVAEALEEHSLDTPADKLIGKARDSLARRRLAAKRLAPRELTRAEFFAWVQGEATPTAFPVIFDAVAFRLTDEEAGEVSAWVARDHRATGGAVAPGTVAVPAVERVRELLFDIKAGLSR